MTTDTLFQLRMAPAQSEEHARAIAAQGGATSGALELRVVPVDANGQVTEVAGPEEVERVMIDLRVLPAAEAEPEDTAGYRLRPPTSGPLPEPSSKIWQLAPGLALKLTLPDPPPVDEQDVQGFWFVPFMAYNAAVLFVGGYGAASFYQDHLQGYVEGKPAYKTPH